MIPVGFRSLGVARQLRLYATVSSGRQAMLRFRLDGPDLFTSGYCPDTGSCGGWCLLRLAGGERFSAFCPGGGGVGGLLQEALVLRAESRCLVAWCEFEAARRSVPGCPAACRPNQTLRTYRAGRLFLLPASPSPTVVRVVRSLVVRRSVGRYYHYIFLDGVPSP